MSDDLEALKAHLEEARRIAREADDAAVEARRAYETALCARYRFQPGDIIRSTDGELAKVTQVLVRWNGPEAEAVLRKKDGSFGTQKKASMWRKEWANATLHERPERGPQS